MGKFNDSYLKPALNSLQGSAESILDRANSATNRVNAESDALRDKSRAERTFRENLSMGYKVLLILIGIGILSLLLAWAATLIIKALKDETAAVEKLKVIDKRVLQSDQKLQELSNAISGTKYITSSDLKSYFNDQAKILGEIKAQTSDVSSGLDKLKTALATSQKEIPSQSVEANTNYSGYTLQKFANNENSRRCFENGSYKTPCTDTVEYSNGWSYSGTWVNGQPEGDGTLTFPGGATIKANWKAGVPIEVEKSEEDEQKILKSITYFQNIPAQHINKDFGDVVIGYNFKSGTDETWQSAYCYIEITRGSEIVTINLSSYASFNASRINKSYKKSRLITNSEFRKVQDLCNYKRSGFN